ncbi:Ig-like domain-containing protein, partial [Gemmatimonadota bacterium]
MRPPLELTIRRSSFAFLLLLFPLLLTCGGDGGGGTGPVEEEGIGPSGGTETLAAGAVTVSVPSGALSSNVQFTSTPTSSVPSTNLLVAGSAYDIGPSGTTFAMPVTITISYDPANIPEGVQEDELGLFKVVGGVPVLQTNSSVNTVSNTVSGQATSLSPFGGWGLPVATVEVSPTSADLQPAETVQLTGTPKAVNGRPLPSRPVTWSSSDEAVATVDGSGLVTAAGGGIATITATSEGKSGTAAITVTVPVASVEVTPASGTVAVAETLQLTAAPKDASGNTLDRTVTWSSSDEAVATVDGTGLVSGVVEGTATVTATSEGVTGTASVTVTDPVSSVDVVPASATLTVGETTQLTATPRGVGGNALEGREIVWTSSDPAVAGVSGSGLVSGDGVGVATVTATSEGVPGSASITVNPRPVASVEVTPSSVTLVAAQTQQLTATARDASGNVLTGRAAAWASSDENVATVEVGGLVTAVGVGSATITATIEGISGTASVTVSPVPVASVEVTPSSASLAPGQRVQLSSTARDASGNVLSGRSVTWASSDEGVATVDTEGRVTAVGDGTADISATSEGITGTAVVTVTTPVASVEVSPATGTIEVGENLQLTATPKDASGNTLERTVTWSSSDEAVATVEGSGLVSGVAGGTAIITATSGGMNGTATVTVANPGFTTCSAQTQIPAVECQALVALYDATNGPEWTNSTDWVSTATPCSWNGVDCVVGSVVRLNLISNQLTGSIPSELGDLSNLTHLHLTSNQLTGSIPPELGNLSNLSSLHLHSNQLTGPIPPDLGSLANLRFLYLFNNQFTGTIPSELGDIHELQGLLLHGNQLIGSIPAELGNLPTVWYLDLGENQLTGPIPPELGNLANLKGL